jgi:hypothetical protein
MSAPIVRIGDLEINQDLRVQKKMWRIQRIGWAAMALLILMGLAGLFGHGPASHTSAGESEGPLWVEYERFGRHQGSSELHIHVRPARASEPVRIWIGPDYTTHVDIQQIMPAPLVSELQDHGVAFDIAAAETGVPAVVTLTLQFRAIGLVTAEVRSPGVDPITIRQFVYP